MALVLLIVTHFPLLQWYVAGKALLYILSFDFSSSILEELMLREALGDFTWITN